MDSSAEIRHCAFCLNSINDKAIKLCGKCRRRAYCSRDCQVADWFPQGKGQGHKIWCQLQCGEEDIDWKVDVIPGKGLGLIAKRMLPVRYRIMVDCDRINDKDHPAIKDLMPINGTYEEKFHFNCLGCGNDNGSTALCLRISRANHNCNANADYLYDETFETMILFCKREIAVGEEICINYQSYTDITRNITAQQARSVLQKKWGIYCPRNCFCYDKEMEKIIVKSKKLDQKLFGLASQKNTRSLDMVNELMKNHEILNSTFLNKTRTFFDGFQIAIMRKSTLPLAKMYIEKLYDIQSAIMSPESLPVKKSENLLKDMTKHPNYLLFE